MMRAEVRVLCRAVVSSNTIVRCWKRFPGYIRARDVRGRARNAVIVNPRRARSNVRSSPCSLAAKLAGNSARAGATMCCAPPGMHARVAVTVPGQRSHRSSKSSADAPRSRHWPAQRERARDMAGRPPTVVIRVDPEYGTLAYRLHARATLVQMATLIDTWAADGSWRKHEKLDSDERAQQAISAAISQQRALGRTVTEAGNTCAITDESGALLLRIAWRKAGWV
jgi:hypothetical protein